MGKSSNMGKSSDGRFVLGLYHSSAIVAFMPGVMADFAIPAFLKFLISFSATVVICFVSYHYGVRNTFIGKLLNGKTHETDKNEKSK